jgi:hypothetical protein
MPGSPYRDRIISPASQTASLVCHPQTPSKAAGRVEAVVTPTDDEALELAFFLGGDIDGLRIPSPRQPVRTDRLWEHTCFEVFIGASGTRAYHEFNFAPSGEWAHYAFSDYRKTAAMTVPQSEPQIAVKKTADALELRAVVRLAPLLQEPRVRLRLGLSAVIEEETGLISYWAMRHVKGKPDFHHPDVFALKIDLRAGEDS